MTNKHTTITPPPLNPGDTIGVMAPSSAVEREDIEKSAAHLESLGYKIFIHPQTFERHNQSAGTELQKTLALQGLWQRDDINAIWAAGGGNRALHFIDSINFNAMKAKPKPLIGFSDVTALLNAITAHTGIITYHGPVFKLLHKHKHTAQALKVLAGEETTYNLSSGDTLREGIATGPLIGGNLSIFQYLPQTLPGEFWKDSILFLEDCGDELSRFDRMLIHLKRLGVLGQIKALILGEFTDIKDTGAPYGFTWEDIIQEHTEDLDIPILMGAPFGHAKNLLTFPIGAAATLDTSAKTLKLSR